MTAWVASGVMSRGASPVPPVVRIRSRRSSSAHAAKVDEICPRSSGTTLYWATLAPGIRSSTKLWIVGPPTSARSPRALRSLQVKTAYSDAGALLAVTVPVSFVSLSFSHAYLLPPGRVYVLRMNSRIEGQVT